MNVDVFANALLAGALCAIAFLIGATSIGGVLLGPALNILGDVPLHVAIPGCMFAFIFTGSVGAVFFTRGGATTRKDLVELTLGSGIGAFAGSFALAYLPSFFIQLNLAALCIASGIRSLMVGTNHRGAGQFLRPTSRILFVIGVVTGFGSALTGTGGPLILMPCLMALRMDTKQAVGLAHVVQLPIGILATTGNLLLDRVDFAIALPLTATVVVGVTIGAIFAQRVSTRFLGKSVAVLLVGTGVALGWTQFSN